MSETDMRRKLCRIEQCGAQRLPPASWKAELRTSREQMNK